MEHLNNQRQIADPLEYPKNMKIFAIQPCIRIIFQPIAPLEVLTRS